MSEEDYRRGVLAERKRAALVCLRAVRSDGTHSEEGHQFAHLIAKAGEYMPPDLEDESEWSVFGERREYRDMPTFFEQRESLGETLVRRTIRKLRSRLRAKNKGNTITAEAVVEAVAQDAREDMAEALRDMLTERDDSIQRLERTVETLTAQLSGKIGLTDVRQKE